MYAAVLSDPATALNYTASNSSTVKDNIMFNPIFGMLTVSSSVIQNIPDMIGYLYWLSSKSRLTFVKLRNLATLVRGEIVVCQSNKTLVISYKTLIHDFYKTTSNNQSISCT